MPSRRFAMLTEYKASGIILLKSRRMARASRILAAETAAIFPDKLAGCLDSHLCGHSHIERPVINLRRGRLVGGLPQVVIEQCRSKLKLSLLPVYPGLFLFLSHFRSFFVDFLKVRPRRATKLNISLKRSYILAP